MVVNFERIQFSTLVESEPSFLRDVFIDEVATFLKGFELCQENTPEAPLAMLRMKCTDISAVRRRAEKADEAEKSKAVSRL